MNALQSGNWLHRDRILIYPLIILALTIASTTYVLITNGGLLPNGSPFGSDFVSFWAAAREAIAGNAHVPYDRDLFEPAQKALFPQSGYFAFFYPPHYLAYMLPLGMVGYYPAFVIWMCFSFAIATWALVQITNLPKETMLLALAFPATFLTVAHGQNAFLSAALFGGGLVFLRNRPILAGVLFGLLTFKPQLGLLIPLVLVAGGYWRTIFSAGATLIGLVLLSALLFGIDIWTVFISQSGYAVETMREGLVDWQKMISPYAALRLTGASDVFASVLHWGLAMFVGISVIWVWIVRHTVGFETKAALLLIAALIVTPFSLNYDLFLLAPALAFIASRGMQHGFMNYEKSFMALTFMAPILMLLFMSDGVSLAPIFTIGFFVLVLRRAFYETVSPHSITNLLPLNRKKAPQKCDAFD